MNMRWYQHSTQGGRFITSLKKSAVSVEDAATSQHTKTSLHPSSCARTRLVVAGMFLVTRGL
jgi:hypothetical protein